MIEIGMIRHTNGKYQFTADVKDPGIATTWRSGLFDSKGEAIHAASIYADQQIKTGATVTFAKDFHTT